MSLQRKAGDLQDDFSLITADYQLVSGLPK
jgi:hypothetical protein